MKAFWENLVLELRAAVRSKAFALLFLATVVWMVVSPFVLRTDGTSSGSFELRVRYSFGVVFAFVLISLVSSAAGTMAKDRTAKRLQLTLVRPVRFFSVALGRMAALTAIGSFLMAVAAVTLWCQTGRGRTCDHLIEPDFPSVEEEADTLIAQWMDDPEQEAFRAKVAEVGVEPFRVYLASWIRDKFEDIPPGGRCAWPFRTEGFDSAEAVSVRVRMTDLVGRCKESCGRFTLGERTGDLTVGESLLVKVPLSPGEVSGTLCFENIGTGVLVLHPRRDLALLLRGDSFAFNLFRAWIVLTCIQSFLISLALFLGSALSRAVAIFSAVAMIVFMVCSPVVIDDYPDPLTMSGIDRIGYSLTTFSGAMLRPVNDFSPVSSIEDEVFIEWRDVGRAVAFDGLLYPILFALLAGLVMGRKQDGL